MAVHCAMAGFSLIDEWKSSHHQQQLDPSWSKFSKWKEGQVEEGIPNKKREPKREWERSKEKSTAPANNIFIHLFLFVIWLWQFGSKWKKESQIKKGKPRWMTEWWREEARRIEHQLITFISCAMAKSKLNFNFAVAFFWLSMTWTSWARFWALSVSQSVHLQLPFSFLFF